ncbi:hypothetical protein CEW92_08465 [Bacillaceae bacterium SAS-127]|nr:hypothetical protein CEW92_08465 [Bacillaceae bacterium SAS-127]
MKVYQPSINVVHDIGRDELFQSFVPNHKQLDIINDILKGVLHSSEKSHLLIGPYGAGKSMVGALIASLLLMSKRNKVVQTFIEDINTVSPSVSSTVIDTISAKKMKWLTVAITGRQGNFEEIILSNIEKQLKQQKVEIHCKNDAQKMLNTIALWKKEYPDTYRKLLMLCEKDELTIDSLVGFLEQSNDNIMQLFKEYYHMLSAGAEFVSENDTPFLEQIAYILAQLKKKKYALFIVFDEFGRFLQTVQPAYIFETMQTIQDLAEFTNRVENIGLLCITHTGLQQYTTTNQALTKSELDRVEKRFIEHRLESDSSTFYRSAYKILGNLQQETSFITDSELEILHHKVTKYNLFPEMKPEEREGSVLKGCQPIHPLTIRLLPALSNKLGQNDRTLYLFLTEVEERTDGEWYYVDQLFDYFYPDDSVLFTIEPLKYYRMALNYNVSSQAIRLVKMITLLNILNTPFKADRGFLAFSLGYTEEYTGDIILELEQKKLLRFNRFIDAYELYSGSIVEFEGLYNDTLRSTVITDERRIGIIEEIFGDSYYLPYRYNNKKSMTRFVKAVFVWADQLHDFTVGNEADGYVVYVLVRNNETLDIAIDFIKKQRSRKSIYCIPAIDIETLISNVDRYEVLTELSKNNQILIKDENLEVEIDIHFQNVLYDLNRLLEGIKQFEKGTTQWYVEGEEKEPFASKHALEEHISEWMYNRFSKTPVICNEVFNKKKVPTIQKKAALSLLNKLLDDDFNGDFQVQGFGPDYLIKATLFEKLNYRVDQLDNLENPFLNELRRDLLNWIHENPKGKIMDLYQILLEEQYGIREPIVPLLTVALLKDKWGQFAFYSKDFSITSMNAEMLYDILEEQVQIFSYEVYELNDDDKNLLQQLNCLFFQSEAILQPISIFRKLTQWLRKLPKFTQITNNQSSELLFFKEIIRLSEIDALLAMQKLHELQQTGTNFESLKMELESFIDEFKTKIEHQTKEIIGITNDDVNEVKRECRIIMNQSPDIAKIIEVWATSDQWLDYAVDRLVNVELQEWSDITYDSYFATLIQKVEVGEQTEAIKLMMGDRVITTINETDLSVKGRTVYNQLSRIVTAGGRTMNPDEVKYVLYKILQELDG